MVNLAIIGLLSICVAFVALCYGIVKRNRSVRQLNSWLEEQVDLLNDFKQRKELLEDHTDDYMNSIGEIGARALYDSRTLIDRVEAMLSDTNYVLNKGKYRSVEHFRNYFLNNDETQLAYCPDLAHYMDTINWAKKMERNIQLIGGEIAMASEKFHELGVERRRRRPTSMSLQAAKINLINKSLD